MSTPLHALLVDDSEDDAILLLRYLRKNGYDVTSERVDTSEALRAALAQGAWDIAFCDYVMPLLPGEEALRILGADAPDLPVITVSGNVGEEFAVNVMRAGAKDYVRKDNLSRLVPAIERELADAAGRRERRKLEQRLRDAEVRAATLFASMEQGVVYQDADGRIIDANPAATRLLGLSLDQLQGRTSVDPRWRAVREDGSPFAGEDHPAMVSLRTRQPTHGVVMGVGVGGAEERRWILVDAVPEFRPGEEAPYRVFTTFTDITARRAGEEKIRQSEQRFRALMRASSDVVYYLNADWSEMHELVGHDFLADTTQPSSSWLEKYVYPDDWAFVRDNVANAIRTRSLVAVEHRVLRADGTVGWTASRTVPILDAHGEIVEWVGMASDVTERKEAEERGEQIHAALEKRVRERTAALETANRELEAFNYSVSHDLRAPLRHVQGFIEIIQEDYGTQLSAEVRSYFDKVRAGTERIAGMVKALLELGRIGRAGLHRRTVEPAEIVRAAWADLRFGADHREVELVVGDLPAASADPGLLRQVFDNLLGNALKFTSPRAAARIEVGSERCDGETAYFVRDNGVGFDAQSADRLFAVFERMHRAEEFEGTGIGLSIVKRIVEKHGGRIWADSEPGKGATFYFTLPLRDDA